MKNYFLYLLKKNILPFVIFTLFCTVLYVVPLTLGRYSYWNNNPPELYVSPPELYLGNLSTALGILAVFIPIFLFSYKMNKRSVDMHFSLPIGRTKILVANFLVGLILLYGSFTVAFWLGFAVAAVKIRRLHLIFYLCQYLASLIPAFVLYAVSAFLFTRANTVADGVIAVIGGLLLGMVAAGALSDIVNGRLSIDSLGFLPFWSLNDATICFDHAIVSGDVRLLFTAATTGYTFAKNLCMLIGGILWTIAAVGATVGLIRSEKNCRAEDCGQISASIFCYKGQLPLYTLFLSELILSKDFDFTNLALLLGFAFLIYVMAIVYKRSAKIGWKFALVLVGCLLPSLLICLIYGIMDFIGPAFTGF